jgi:outer membrane protein assembly factor BamB
MHAAFRCALVFGLYCVAGSVFAADWPGFRGAKGGVADEKDLPAEITKDNVLWKVKLPGAGASSPITAGDKLFLTCYTGYGQTITKGFGGFGGKGKGDFGKDKKPDFKGKPDFGKGGFGKGGFGGGPDTGGDQKKLRLVVLCYDRNKGDVLWQKEIEPKLPEAPFSDFLRDHGYASSTPVTDGKNVYVFLGKSGVYAFDMDGKQLWSADVGSGTDKWGSAASPVVYNDVLIVNAAIESKALVGLDKNSGKELWRVKGTGTNWTSPIIVETKDGTHELVVSLPGRVVGYEPETGKELWRCDGIGSASGFGGYTISTPVARDGVVYLMGGGGFAKATTLAVRAGGRGDVTKTHLLWRESTGTGTASPVLSGDCLCWASGAFTCLNVKDGKKAHQARLYEGGFGGEYVSAVAADGRIYALTRLDGLYVLEGGGKFEQLSHYDFTGDRSIFNASPAVSGGKIYIRSNAYLYCLGKK